MFLMNLKIKPGVDVTRPKGSHMSCKVQNDTDNIEGMFETFFVCIHNAISYQQALNFTKILKLFSFFLTGKSQLSKSIT